MKRRINRAWRLAWVLILPLLLVGCDSMEVQGPEAELEADAAVVAAKNGATPTPWHIAGPFNFDYTLYWSCFGEEIRAVTSLTIKRRTTATPSGNFHVQLRDHTAEGIFTGLASGDSYVITREHLSEIWHAIPPGVQGHFTEIIGIQNERTGQEAEMHFEGQGTVAPDGSVVYDSRNAFAVCPGP